MLILIFYFFGIVRNFGDGIDRKACSACSLWSCSMRISESSGTVSSEFAHAYSLKD